MNHIVKEIQQAKYFSIMIDETTDISKLEQVSLVIRYTDDQVNVHERFMGFQRIGLAIIYSQYNRAVSSDLFGLCVGFFTAHFYNINVCFSK